MSIGTVKQVTNVEIQKELAFIRETFTEQIENFNGTAAEIDRLNKLIDDLDTRTNSWATRFGERLDKADMAWKAVSELAHQMQETLIELKLIVSNESAERVRMERMNEKRHKELVDRAEKQSMDLAEMFTGLTKSIIAAHSEHAEIREQTKEATDCAKATADIAEKKVKSVADASIKVIDDAKKMIIDGQKHEALLTRVILGVAAISGGLITYLAYLAWDHLTPIIIDLLSGKST